MRRFRVPSGPMTEQQIDEGGVSVVAVEGDLDAFTLPKVSAQIDALIQEGAARLVVNLQGLKFIDSSALGYLIGTGKRLREMEGELVVSQPSTIFRTTMNTLGLAGVFRIFDDDRSAQAHFDAN